MMAPTAGGMYLRITGGTLKDYVIFLSLSARIQNFSKSGHSEEFKEQPAINKKGWCGITVGTAPAVIE
jgi:hypothetical protein